MRQERDVEDGDFRVEQAGDEAHDEELARAVDGQIAHLDADTLAKIVTPLLITSPDHEQFWPGQSEEMHAAVQSSTIVTFTEAEGADWHCEPAAHGLRDERVFNWLEDIL